jgi:hypothetical protein
MNKVQELQKQLRVAEYEESKKAWLEWYEQGKRFLDSVVGKCFLWKSGGRDTTSFFMFKVIGYKTVGMIPSTVHPGFFEVETDGYFEINRANYSFRRNSPAGDAFGTFPLTYRKKGGNREVVSNLNYDKTSLNKCCCVNNSRVTTYGYYKLDKPDDFESGEMYLPRPRKSVREEMIGLGVYEADENLYNEAKALADEFALRTRELWGKYQKQIEEAQYFRIYE